MLLNVYKYTIEISFIIKIFKNITYRFKKTEKNNKIAIKNNNLI